MKLHLHLDSGIVCKEGLTPCPAPTLAINDRITHKQQALSEHNELSVHNELDDRIELDDRSSLALNDHDEDISVERIRPNIRPPSNDALIVLMTPPLGCDKTIVDA